MNKAFERFKALADKKKNVYDEDLMAIVAEEAVRVPDRYELAALDVTSSSDGGAARDRPAPHRRRGAARGRRPATASSTPATARSRKPTGTHLHARALRREGDHRRHRRAGRGLVPGARRRPHRRPGRARHTDIIMASALAYLNALNKLEYRKRYAERVRGGP